MFEKIAGHVAHHGMCQLMCPGRLANSAMRSPNCIQYVAVYNQNDALDLRHVLRMSIMHITVKHVNYYCDLIFPRVNVIACIHLSHRQLSLRFVS